MSCKLCINCNHYCPWEATGESNRHRCTAREPKVDLVTGVAKPWLCSTLRSFKDQCGPDGNWFVKKEPEESVHQRRD